MYINEELMIDKILKKRVEKLSRVTFHKSDILQVWKKIQDLFETVIIITLILYLESLEN